MPPPILEVGVFVERAKFVQLLLLNYTGTMEA